VHFRWRQTAWSMYLISFWFLYDVDFHSPGCRTWMIFVAYVNQISELLLGHSRCIEINLAWQLFFFWNFNSIPYALIYR
jgi:hypothetical protein